jgi:hypothetical protein
VSGIPPGIDPETKSRIQRILKMTGHDSLDMLQNFIDEGVMEVIRIYSRNEKYKDLFPKFFPEFVDQNLDVPAKEDEAVNLFQAMRSEFGWAGTIFVRGDVESAARRDLTDEEWNRVKASYPWRKGIPDRTCEMSVDHISMALSDAGITPAKCRKCECDLDDDRYCTDSACPYSDHLQDEEFTEG